MSDETLSQDEVAALLQGVHDGDVALDAESAPRGTVLPYDLLGEDRLAGRRFPVLELVHERFVRRLHRALANETGVTPVITVGALDTIRFATFRNRVPVGACLPLFSMAPLRGQALLAISAPLAFGLVDRVCGGAGRMPQALDAREYSAVELLMLQRLVTRLLGELSEAWAPVQRLECALVRIEPKAAALALAGPTDAVLVLELACDLGAGAAPLVLAFPYAMLEPIRDRLGTAEAAPPSGSDREWRAAITAAVRQADVTVSAELGTHDISARELLRLRVGDVLGLGVRGDDPVTLRIENLCLMTGLAGVSRGQNAVRIVGVDGGD